MKRRHTPKLGSERRMWIRTITEIIPVWSQIPVVGAL